MFNLDRTDTPAGGDHSTVCLGFELSRKTWQLGVLRLGSDKLSRYWIAGGDLTALASRLTRCRAEAAQDGQPSRRLRAALRKNVAGTKKHARPNPRN